MPEVRRGLPQLRSDIHLSPQMMAALQRITRNSEIIVGIASQYLGANPGLPREDSRDFAEMVNVDLNASEEEVRAAALRYLVDYYDMSNPAKRKTLLDQFYSEAEELDVTRLDLSVLEGRDTGVRGPDGLTDSERDTLKLIRAYRRDQTIAVKSLENPEYFASRYDTPEKRQRYETATDVIVGGIVTYMTNGLLPYNGLDQSLKPGVMPMQEGMEHKANVAIVRQRAEQNLYNGAQKLPLRIKLPAALYIAPGAEANARQKSAAADLFEDTFGNFFDSGTRFGTSVEQMGIDPLDMVFIDNMTANEYLAQQNPDVALRDADKKAMLMQQMAAGGHRFAVGSYSRDASGEIKMQVTEVQADLHAMDGAEKRSKHNWLRRVFDWGPFKLKTKADEQEALEANDPEKETRNAQIKGKLAQTHQAGTTRRNEQQALTDRISARQAARKPIYDELDGMNLTQIEILKDINGRIRDNQHANDLIREEETNLAAWNTFKAAGDTLRGRLRDGKEINHMHIDAMYVEVLNGTDAALTNAILAQKTKTFRIGVMVAESQNFDMSDAGLDKLIAETPEADRTKLVYLAATTLRAVPQEERQAYLPNEMKTACTELLVLHDQAVEASPFRQLATEEAEAGRQSRRAELAQELAELREERGQLLAEEQIHIADTQLRSEFRTFLDQGRFKLFSPEAQNKVRDAGEIEAPHEGDLAALRLYSDALDRRAQARAELAAGEASFKTLDMITTMSFETAAPIGIETPEKMRKNAAEQLRKLSEVKYDTTSGLDSPERALFEESKANLQRLVDDPNATMDQYEYCVNGSRMWKMMMLGMQKSPDAPILGAVSRGEIDPTEVRAQLQDAVKQAEDLVRDVEKEGRAAARRLANERVETALLESQPQPALGSQQTIRREVTMDIQAGTIFGAENENDEEELLLGFEDDEDDAFAFDDEDDAFALDDEDESSLEEKEVTTELEQQPSAQTTAKEQIDRTPTSVEELLSEEPEKTTRPRRNTVTPKAPSLESEMKGPTTHKQ